MQEPYLLIGQIVRPQGVRGEVKVRHFTDDPARFMELENVFVKDGEQYRTVEITGCRVQKDDVFLSLRGTEDRNQAEGLRDVMLYVDRAHARQLGEDEVFIADILGAKAVDTKGNEIGTLRDVLQNSSTDVFVFDTPRGEMMMPALKRVILEMDAAKGRIVLDESKLHEVALFEDSDSDDLS